MNQFEANPWALSLLIPAVVSAYLAHESWRTEYGLKGKVLSLAMLPIILWSVAYGFELASTELEVMKFWLKVEYLAIPYVTPLMLLVIFQIVNLDFGILSRKVSLIFIIPLITMILSLTNDYHHLFYNEVFLQKDGSFPTLKLSFGPWYFVHVTYSYLLVLAGLITLFWKIYYYKSFFLLQRVSMLVAVLSPLISFSVYFLGFMPVKNVDPTPFAFTLSGLALSVSVLRYRLLNLAPIARDHIFQSMLDGIIVVDKSNRLIDCNPAGARIFRWKNIPLGDKLNDIWTNYPELHAFSAQNDTPSTEFKTLIDGKPFSFIITDSDILNKQGKFVGRMLLFHDNTVRNQLLHQIEASEKDLARLNVEKDKLFALIAHDLRGPIHSFVALTGMFTDESYNLTREEIIEMSHSMNKSAQSVQGLLENLLEWSKLQKAAVVIAKENLNLEEIIGQSIRVLSDMFIRKEIKLQVLVDPSMMVIGDEKMLNSVIRNLVTNALKFTPRRGSVTISATNLKNGFIQTDVKDTGIGMNHDVIMNLFQIDQNVGRPGTEGEATSGMGLLLCKEFIEKQGGKISVQSEVSKGSTFSFLLPEA
ncbi:MAG: histidine kinase N-terminal 7TM domain-containing protein [Bacteroidales bacterium]